MPAPASNQTISYLAKRFSEAGIRLNTRHGQNFLIDLNLLRLLVERASLGPHDVVLEVGTGTGALTALIATCVAAVVTVEIDPQLQQLASEELFGLTNIVMLRHDALRNKGNLDPRVIAAVACRMAPWRDRMCCPFGRAATRWTRHRSRSPAATRCRTRHRPWS